MKFIEFLAKYGLFKQALKPMLFLLYILIAYIPFQIALNLSPDVDLMSGRVLITGLFGVWVAREIYYKLRNTRTFFFGPSPALSAPQGEGEIKRGRALILFFLLSAISILGAQNPVWGWRKLLVFASIFPLFWLIAALIKNKKDALYLIYAVIGGAAVSALAALAQFGSQFVFGTKTAIDFWASRVLPLFSGASFGGLVASNPSWLVNINGQTMMRAVGLFPDPHMLAFYLGLTFPFSLALMLLNNRRPAPPSHSRGRKRKWYCFLLFIVNCLLLIILLLTFSRGGYLGLLAGLAVFVLFGWRRLGAKEKKFIGAAVLLAAAILFLAGRPVLARLTSIFNLTEGSNMGRLAIWQESLQIIKENPIFGAGLGNYSLALNFNESYRNSVTSHNLYLDIWAETGIFGLLAWLGLIVYAVKSVTANIDENPVLAIGALSSLAYFSVHSFFETAIFNPTVLAMLMIILGLAASLQTTNKVRNYEHGSSLS